jgi:hypothetical protein
MHGIGFALLYPDVAAAAAFSNISDTFSPICVQNPDIVADNISVRPNWGDIVANVAGILEMGTIYC